MVSSHPHTENYSIILTPRQVYNNEFNNLLHRLFDRRINRLQSLLARPTKGRPPEFTRAKVDKAITQLQDLASACMAKESAKCEFTTLVDKKKRWHVSSQKGRGIDQKKRTFDQWFEEHIPFRHYVYILWEDRRCGYVGRSDGDGGRVARHFDKHWFQDVSRIDVYSTRKGSEVPKLECLAIHRFRPKNNKNRAANGKWKKKCPVCKVHREIAQEVKTIFRLRK